MNVKKYTLGKISLIVLLAALAIILIIIASDNKIESFLWFSQQHTAFGDFFFTIFTLLGDGWFSIISGLVIFLAICKKTGYKVIAAYIISGLFAQALKTIFHLPRPKTFFATNAYIQFNDGSMHSGWNSFPSGHATSAFAFAMVLCLYTKNILLRVIYMVVAFTVGYSRIYLGHHFLEDVFCGAILGLLTGYLVYKYLPVPAFKKGAAGKLVIP